VSWGGDLRVGAPRGAFRPSVIFLCLLALFAAASVMLWTDFGSPGLNVFLFVLAGWLVSLCLHEYAHALVAFRGGDRSVAHKGYLTLNPLLYSHPVLSILLPLLIIIIGGIGLPGGAVMIERHALRSKAWDSLVSLCGPLVNVAFAIVLIVPVVVSGDTLTHHEFWAAAAFLGFLQLTVAVLNLLPVPGLDGGNLLFPWLSPQWQRGFMQVAPYGLLLVMGLLFVPQLNAIFFTLVDLIADVVGLNPLLYYEGLRLFRFWS
jgi:Zn-dependent protease